MCRVRQSFALDLTLSNVLIVIAFTKERLSHTSKRRFQNNIIILPTILRRCSNVFILMSPYQQGNDLTLNVLKRRFIKHVKTLSYQQYNDVVLMSYNVVLSKVEGRFPNFLIITLFYQQFNDVALTSSLQGRFIINITTSLGRLLI